MKVEDFITIEGFENTLDKIEAEKGRCVALLICTECPFRQENAKNDSRCTTNNYASTGIHQSEKDYVLLESVKQFRKLIKEEKMENYLVINGKKAELTSEQLEALGLKPEVKFGELGLREGETIFAVNHKGNVVKVINSNDWDDVTNCSTFKTEAQAERYKEITEENKVFNQIRRWVIENDNGWRADWNDEGQCKYSIVYDADRKSYRVGSAWTVKESTAYMSKKNANKLLEILNNM